MSAPQQAPPPPPPPPPPCRCLRRRRRHRRRCRRRHRRHRRRRRRRRRAYDSRHVRARRTSSACLRHGLLPTSMCSILPIVSTRPAPPVVPSPPPPPPLSRGSACVAGMATGGPHPRYAMRRALLALSDGVSVTDLDAVVDGADTDGDHVYSSAEMLHALVSRTGIRERVVRDKLRSCL